MFIKQLYTNCLAEAAYYIESEGVAAIIDPIRETAPYLELAAERGTQIRYVFETHFHADFVSGHIDLSRETGATIVYGPEADTGYPIYKAKEGEEFSIGRLTIRVIHTPGHTLESSCYLLLDEDKKPHALFTGDTLFVGDVGRPDLLDGVMTKEELARMMYDSLQKIKTLPDEVIVYPAHGPGSACGKNIGKETWSTIGQQKHSNYALKSPDKETFIREVTSGLMPPPAYFFSDARINKSGYENIDAVISRNMKPLTPEDFKKLTGADTIILDTRTPDDFEKGFIEGSINIGLNGTFAVWAGSLLDIKKPILLVTEPGKEHESILRLARVGYENVKGFLEGGIKSWVSAGLPVHTIRSVSPEEFSRQSLTTGNIILDVRKEGEFEAGHVKGARHVSLIDLPSSLGSLSREGTYLVHCAGGYRSMIACSVMKAAGFSNIINVYKGFGGIKETAADIVIPQKTAV
jgi:hydroxyacylglutathione hydrolase